MIMRKDGNMESETSCEESSSSSEVESSSDSSHDGVISSWCHVKGKLRSIIIDGGNSVNVASLRLVEKLNLPTLVTLAFTIGKNSNEILCDVVPMKATHILLGRPWQFDKKVTHDGVTNIFSIVTLKPLSPREVSEDQLKMKIKRKKEQKEHKQKEKLEKAKRKETKKNKEKNK
ncbi:hypothetical protein CR513_24133, partial [Mucuna pruriens]